MYVLILSRVTLVKQKYFCYSGLSLVSLPVCLNCDNTAFFADV